MAGKARWLLENMQQLSAEQRALLLAVADLDVESGCQLTAEERAAVDQLSAQADGFDAQEIERAVRHMVKAKSKRKVIEWPSGLYQRIRRKR